MNDAANTKAQLENALQSLGLTSGDHVIVHSSYRALRPFDGGPADVIDAICDVIGPDGNLMLPTFNYSSPLPKPHYDPDKTPCRTGIIAELGRQRPDAVRSLHPTHSATVIGPDAQALTADHLKGRALGINSPIDRLAQRGGKILLIGVGQIANSTIHVAEEHARLPKVCRCDPMPLVGVRLPDGTIIEHQLDSSPSCSAGFEAAVLPLRQVNAITDGKLGGCLMQLIDARAVIDQVSRLLADQPGALLCNNSACTSCQGIRRNLA